jgi:DNA replication protein DnaC
LSVEETLNLLTACYASEVERRKLEFVLDDSTAENLQSLTEYITADTPKIGVMICGTCGNGKSTMMYAFRRAVDYLARRQMFSFMSEYFKARLDIFDVNRLIELSKDKDEFAKIMRFSMLGIDDLGTEPGEIMEYGNISSPIRRLLETRYNTQSFTFITTNLTPSQIREKYGDRIADRLNEMFEKIVFKNSSYRGR